PRAPRGRRAVREDRPADSELELAAEPDGRLGAVRRADDEQPVWAGQRPWLIRPCWRDTEPLTLAKQDRELSVLGDGGFVDDSAEEIQGWGECSSRAFGVECVLLSVRSESTTVPAQPGFARRSYPREARVLGGKGAHGGNRLFPPC